LFLRNLEKEIDITPYILPVGNFNKLNAIYNHKTRRTCNGLCFT